MLQMQSHCQSFPQQTAPPPLHCPRALQLRGARQGQHSSPGSRGESQGCTARGPRNHSSHPRAARVREPGISRSLANLLGASPLPWAVPPQAHLLTGAAKGLVWRDAFSTALASGQRALTNIPRARAGLPSHLHQERQLRCRSRARQEASGQHVTCPPLLGVLRFPLLLCC